MPPGSVGDKVAPINSAWRAPARVSLRRILRASALFFPFGGVRSGGTAGQWGGLRESAGCRGNGSRADCRGAEGIPAVCAWFSLAHQDREVDQDRAETSEGEEGAFRKREGLSCPDPARTGENPQQCHLHMPHFLGQLLLCGKKTLFEAGPQRAVDVSPNRLYHVVRSQAFAWGLPCPLHGSPAGL